MSNPYPENTGNPVVEHPEGTPPPGEKGTLTDAEKRESLLKLKPERVVARLVREWEGSFGGMRNLFAQWRVNHARSLGYTGVALLKVQNESRAYFPMGSSPNPRLFNKARTLCRRVRSLLFADPPVLEATPTTDEDIAVDSAEFASRALSWEADKLDFDVVSGDAFDLASDYASGFLWIWSDPTAGGWRPREVECAPTAIDAKAPLVDPTNGKPADPTALVKKYVTEDGRLTDDKRDPKVEKMWMPGLRRQILTGKQVRLLPPTCRDIWDADGSQIGAMLPLGMLRGMFGEDRKDVDGSRIKGLGSIDEDELKKIVSYAPRDVKEFLPPGYKLKRGGEPTDETLVFCLTRYHVTSPTYPKGFYAVVLGESHLAYRGEWYDDRNVEPLLLPLAQFEQVHDEDQPFGHGLMEYLGAGNEVLASMVDTELTHLERLANRRIFLPLQSPMQEEQLQSPTGTVLRVPPGMGPTYEDVPPFPQPVIDMHKMMSDQLDNESGLQQQAQAVNMPSVTSGTQANAIVEQVRVMLSDLIQHTARALTRSGQIMLQQMRWTYTVPQLMTFAGEDGLYREKAFTASDLGSTRDVQIKQGSFTQLAVTAKAALIEQYKQAGYLSLEEAQHAVVGQVGGMLGVQDNPHRLRIKGQVARWRHGPPDGWTPPQPPPQVQPGQPPAPPAPDPANPFDRRAVDMEPEVAKLRAYELGRQLASRRVTKVPAEWTKYLADEYDAMRKAAGIAFTSETQQFQQQQQQQAQANTDAEHKINADKVAVDNKKVELDRERLQHEQNPPVERPRVSVSASVQDPEQTRVILADAGYDVPPAAPKAPKMLRVKHVRDASGALVASEPEYEQGGNGATPPVPATPA